MSKRMLLIALAILIFGSLAGVAQDESTIFVTVGAYYPDEPTENNPDPPTMMNTIVAEYEAANPGVNIELVDVPSNISGDQWRSTVFNGQNEPHIIVNNYIRVWQEQGNDWYVPLNEHIEAPNPYIPEGTAGSERWADAIPEVVWNTTFHTGSGNQYVVTVNAVAVGFFYNIDMLTEMGIDTEFDISYSLWEDWETMIAEMGAIEETGMKPLALSMSTAAPYTYNWFDGTSLTSMYIDHIESWWEPGASWHALNQREFACAIQNGLISANDDAFADWLGLLADFEPMWVEGYSTLTNDETYRLFVTGEVPFLLQNAASQTINVSRDVDFNWGISYFPPVTGTTSPHAANNESAYLVGGFTSGFTVTDRARREGITDQVVDFLMYMTAQPQWGRVVTDSPRSIPTQYGLDVPDALKPTVAFLELPIRALKDPDPRLSRRYGEDHRRLMQEYFTDQIDLETLIAEEDRLMSREARVVIAENDWSCDFQME